MDTTWKVYSASVQGKSHIDRGLPCQDANAFERRQSWLVAVVCDGAGSAANSEIGAQSACQGIAKRLMHVLDVEAQGIDAARAKLTDCITAARDELKKVAMAAPAPFDQLACTVVGVVAGADQGFLFHIGDGAGLVEMRDEPVTRFVSGPENGEYANETYFLTDDHWLEHLSVTEFNGKVSCIALMSDGAMPFVMNRVGNEFSRPFIDPVTRYLLANDEAVGSEALGETLSSEGTWSITGDDKTLLLAYLVD